MRGSWNTATVGVGGLGWSPSAPDDGTDRIAKTLQHLTVRTTGKSFADGGRELLPDSLREELDAGERNDASLLRAATGEDVVKRDALSERLQHVWSRLEMSEAERVGLSIK